MDFKHKLSCLITGKALVLSWKDGYTESSNSLICNNQQLLLADVDISSRPWTWLLVTLGSSITT